MGCTGSKWHAQHQRRSFRPHLFLAFPCIPRQSLTHILLSCRQFRCACCVCASPNNHWNDHQGIQGSGSDDDDDAYGAGGSGDAEDVDAKYAEEMEG